MGWAYNSFSYLISLAWQRSEFSPQHHINQARWYTPDPSTVGCIDRRIITSSSTTSWVQGQARIHKSYKKQIHLSWVLSWIFPWRNKFFGFYYFLTALIRDCPSLLSLPYPQDNCASVSHELPALQRPFPMRPQSWEISRVSYCRKRKLEMGSLCVS